MYLSLFIFDNNDNCYLFLYIIKYTLNVNI